MDTLVQANEQAHEAIEERYLQAVEHLLAHELDEARREFAAFEHILMAHMSEENECLLPLLEPASTAAQTVARQVVGDHVILRRVSATAREALDALDDKSPSLNRDIIDALQPILRVRRVLYHHGVREARELYPRLQGLLSRDEHADAAARLSPSRPPRGPTIAPVTMPNTSVN